ncbi:serine/threonine-protein kinase [Mycoplasmopsis mustelae]|uniref:Serine/threonine-protein kinase n=1 Tax=Mycoplasmopsis mustelae TaxID=171289 RepID=A0A4V3FNU5_9BACT|nr:serine/threonine-protein kinase [Mycoplasmopsis mustelae]TDV22698.1 serine/threonine-protein kinase [Mycoplasmopsis mustelae]
MKNNFGIPKDSIIFKKYNITKIIGQGGMGMVFLVRTKDSHNIQQYALKYRLNDNNQSNKMRFWNEIKLLENINHRNIPKLISYHFDDDEQFYLMEYIQGDTLYNVLQKSRQLNITRANNYIRQLADTIDELHNYGIIHRDIKSQNIMISDDYNLKIIDLGISISEDNPGLTKTNAVVCSPYYAAPEFSRVGSKITKAVDIYALGVLYFEMIAGTLPFKGDNELNTIYMHNTEPFPDIRRYKDNVPNSVVNIITKATAKDPKDRYQSAAEMRRDVGESLKPHNKIQKLISRKTMKEKKTLIDFLNSPWFLGSCILIILIIIGLVVGFSKYAGVI